MSNKGIYTALSGAMAQDLRMETIANNMANVNTPGFKRDEQVFREYLTAYEKQDDVIQVPKIPASIESFYALQAGDRGYVDSAGTYTDQAQGSLRSTGNQLDVALEGEGYFEVLTPQGIRYTRSGSFTLSPEGRLISKQGFPVLRRGEGAENPETRFIEIGNTTNITFSGNGSIFSNGAEVGALSVVNVSDQNALRKVGGLMYGLKENYQATVANVPNPSMRQGFLENSNVNIIQEMTDMIGATRVFESTQKAIQAYDSMNDKLVNTVPSLR
ncbi:MAG: flagellar basal-body rod protein FlgF [Bdellovibrionales bacterium]|nr:flagellar basal-body rod protein FlgF [Bdellovibrionales bacterium]